MIISGWAFGVRSGGLWCEFCHVATGHGEGRGKNEERVTRAAGAAGGHWDGGAVSGVWFE